MKISYDAEVDAFRIVFAEGTVITRDLGDGLAADFDEDGKLAGIEILDAEKRLAGKAPLRQVVLENLSAAT